MKYFLTVGAVLVAGCLLDPESKEATPAGQYDLVAYRDDGEVETKGWILLEIAEDGTITGTWSLTSVDGDGKLAGRKDEETVEIDLHPGWADHNFLLHGTYEDATISGRWEFVGFAGPMKAGTFEAKK